MYNLGAVQLDHLPIYHLLSTKANLHGIILCNFITFFHSLNLMYSVHIAYMFMTNCFSSDKISKWQVQQTVGRLSNLIG